MPKKKSRKSRKSRKKTSRVFKVLEMVRNKTRKKKSKKGKKRYRSRKTLNKIWGKNTAKAKCVTLTKGTWNKKRKHCSKNPKCYWSSQLDICLSKKKY